MTWSWSHTQEAYDNAEDNLDDLSDEVLQIAYAEWKASVAQSSSPRWNRIYLRAMANAKNTPHDILVDFIWEQTQKQQDCDNGGFNAYICPYGCHTVSFNR